MSGYQGLNVLVQLNWDRLLYPAMVFAALLAGAFLGSMLTA
ncbi:hypothetical protein [Roseovarius salinarum]|nr:hypothetical protein [Roseovarius salinarum]